MRSSIIGVVLIAVSVVGATGGSTAAAARTDWTPPANPLSESWITTPGASLGRYYPGSLVGEQFSSPAVGDLYGNGTDQVVVGGVDGRINIYDARTGGFIRRFDVSNIPGVVVSSPTLADLDGDGRLDIVVGFMPESPIRESVPKGSPTVAALTPDGQVLWSRRLCSPLPGHYCDFFASPVVADIEGDGLPEVIITGQDQMLHVMRGLTGQDLPGFPFDLLDTSWSTPAVADLTGNGRLEIVVASDVAKVTCQHYSSLGCRYGTILRVIDAQGIETHRRVMDGEIPMSSPVIGHIQGPGNAPQIVIGSGNTFWASRDSGYDLARTASRRVYAFSSTLEPLPGWSAGPLLDAPDMATPALGDVDGNGLDTVFTISTSGMLSAFDGSGTRRWGPVCARDSSCSSSQTAVGRSSPVLADLNDDGRVEVIVNTEHTVHVYDARTGQELGSGFRISRPPGGMFTFAATPAVVELDGKSTVFFHGLRDSDQNHRRSAGDEDVLAKYVASTSLGAAPWPGFHGGAQRTGTSVSMRPSPPQGCAATDPGKYVSWLYTRLLGVGPTPQQLVRGCTTQAAAPGVAGRRLVASSSVHSRAWVTIVVEGLYRDILGREPDPGGAQFWIGRILSGERQRDVAIALEGSDEQYRRWGGTTSDATPYVTKLYEHVLGRPADPGGLAYWSQVALGDHEAAAARFYQSHESRTRRVTSLYGRLLCRGPDTAGREFWAGRLLTQDDLALAQNLVTSGEFYQGALSRSCPAH